MSKPEIEVIEIVDSKRALADWQALSFTMVNEVTTSHEHV